MTISELGSLGEFVGSIAVLITLIYLVLQIRQSRLSIASQSRYYVLEAVNADMRQVQEPAFFELAEKVSSGEPTHAESTRWAYTITAWFSHLEMLYYEIAEGALPAQFEETMRFRIRSSFVNPMASEVWNRMRGYFTADFQSYVDGLLEEFAESGDRGAFARQVFNADPDE